MFTIFKNNKNYLIGIAEDPLIQEFGVRVSFTRQILPSKIRFTCRLKYRFFQIENEVEEYG
jgi:hypothetical protein